MTGVEKNKYIDQKLKKYKNLGKKSPGSSAGDKGEKWGNFQREKKGKKGIILGGNWLGHKWDFLQNWGKKRGTSGRNGGK